MTISSKCWMLCRTMFLIIQFNVFFNGRMCLKMFFYLLGVYRVGAMNVFSSLFVLSLECHCCTFVYNAMKRRNHKTVFMVRFFFCLLNTGARWWFRLHICTELQRNVLIIKMTQNMRSLMESCYDSFICNKKWFVPTNWF